MVVRRYAVIRNLIEVENVIVLDDSLASAWFSGDLTRELIEDTGQGNIEPGGTYDRARFKRNRFTLKVISRTRFDNLSDKVSNDTATFSELMEYTRIRDDLR